MRGQGESGVELVSDRQSSTVLVVDDHPMFRLGVAHFLEPNDDLRVIEATSQAEASIALRENDVQLAIVDISLPDGSGLELIRHQRTQHRDTRWLVLSVYSEPFHQMRAKRAGANGFLSKRVVQNELMQAVTMLLNGQDYPPGFESQVETEKTELEILSEREMTIFRKIAEGLSVEQIANSLSRSRKTVNAIRDRIRAKLSIGSSAELSRFATHWYLSQSETGPPAPKSQAPRPDSSSSIETPDSDEPPRPQEF